MKTLVITICVALFVGATAEAGNRSSACQNEQACCSPCQTTRWYKAKDGTYREMMPYMKALSRSEDADDMEPVLKKTQEELATAAADVEAIKAELAQMKAAMEAQLAEVSAQRDAEKQNVASQQERGDKAEAAHKLCIEQISQLRDEAKKNEEALASAQGELKTVTEERDSLKTGHADLEKQVSELTAAREAAEGARKKAEEELEKAKQEAAESKKAAVEGEPAEKEGDDPKAGDEKPPEPNGEPAPEVSPPGN